MASITEKEVGKAMARRKEYFLENIETLTARSVRRQLEEDLGLDEGELDQYKKFISTKIDEIVNDAEDEEPPEEDEFGQEDPDDEEYDTRKKNSKKRKKPEKKQQSEKQLDYTTTSQKLERLKEVCRQATIKIPVTIYKSRNIVDREVAVEKLLEKHGLGERSNPDTVRRVKAKLAKDKEMEGIDMTNIIERPRRRAASQRAVEIFQKEDEDDDEENPISGEKPDDDPEAGADGEAKAKAKGSRKKKKKPADDDFIEEGGDDEDESIQEDDEPPPDDDDDDDDDDEDDLDDEDFDD